MSLRDCIFIEINMNLFGVNNSLGPYQISNVYFLEVIEKKSRNFKPRKFSGDFWA